MVVHVDEVEPRVIEGEQLRGTYAEIEPGYHLNKRHWLTVTCGGAAADGLVQELIGGSYDLVAGAARR